MARKSKAKFSMKGHSIPGIKGFKGTALEDGRAASSAFQQKSPMKDQKSIRRRSDQEAHEKRGDHTWASHGSPKDATMTTNTRADEMDEAKGETKSPIKHSLADMKAMGVEYPEGMAFATDPDVQTEKYPMQDFLGEEGNLTNHDQKHALGYTHTGGGTTDQDDVTWQAKNLPRNKEMDEGYEEKIEEKIIEEPIVEDVEPKPQPKWMTEESATPMKSPLNHKTGYTRHDGAHTSAGDTEYLSHQGDKKADEHPITNEQFKEDHEKERARRKEISKQVDIK